MKSGSRIFAAPDSKKKHKQPSRNEIKTESRLKRATATKHKSRGIARKREQTNANEIIKASIVSPIIKKERDVGHRTGQDVKRKGEKKKKREKNLLCCPAHCQHHATAADRAPRAAFIAQHKEKARAPADFPRSGSGLARKKREERYVRTLYVYVCTEKERKRRAARTWEGTVTSHGRKAVNAAQLPPNEPARSSRAAGSSSHGTGYRVTSANTPAGNARSRPCFPPVGLSSSPSLDATQAGETIFGLFYYSLFLCLVE